MDNNNQENGQADEQAPAKTEEQVPAEVETPAPEEIPAVPHEEHHSLMGIIIAVLVVILVLILGGFYLWGSGLIQSDIEPAPTEQMDDESVASEIDADIRALETVSDSDEVKAIETDLESTLLDELDAELGTIGDELGQ